MYLRPDKWYNEKVMRNSINPLVFYLFFFLVIVGLIFSDYQQHRQVEVQTEKEVQIKKLKQLLKPVKERKIRLSKTDWPR